MDARLPGDEVAFRWRGRGMLSAITSNWRVFHLDPDYRWAVIAFSRSLFTPAGLDIIGREPELPDEVMAHIKDLVGPTPGLFAVPQR